MFAVQAPNGEALSVTVPTGVMPGFPFTILVPPHVLAAPPSVTAVPIGLPVHQKPTSSMSKATVPKPADMQRIGDAIRATKRSATQSELPPLSGGTHCTCLGDNEIKGRWELPPVLTTAGCITTVKMDLRDHDFPPGQRSITLRHYACIHNNELLIPPEVNVQGSGCACIPSTDVNDKRPKELRGTPLPSAKVRRRSFGPHRRRAARAARKLLTVTLTGGVLLPSRTTIESLPRPDAVRRPGCPRAGGQRGGVRVHRRHGRQDLGAWAAGAQMRHPVRPPTGGAIHANRSTSSTRAVQDAQGARATRAMETHSHALHGGSMACSRACSASSPAQPRELDGGGLFMFYNN